MREHNKVFTEVVRYLIITLQIEINGLISINLREQL